MDEEVDLSQLMAFADALSETPGLGDLAWSADDTISETQPWAKPFSVTGYKSGFAGLLQSVRLDGMGSGQNSASPDSPVAKNRTSLFSQEDMTIEIEVCGESLDPRALFVVDHPGRHAQFKAWVQAGYLSDETKRISIRDESSKPACWNQIGTDGNRSSIVDGGILGGLIKSKTTVELPIPLKPDLQLGETENVKENSPDIASETKPGRSSWKERAFVVGKTIKVAMREMGLHDTNIREWCIWFNDLLCSIGLSDVRNAPNPSASIMEADMDFSGNALSDGSLLELLTLFSAFRRLHVRSLRLSSNMLTDLALQHLAGLTRLKHLVMDDNTLTSHGVMSFVLRNRTDRRDLYEALLAQDVADDSLAEPIALSLESNGVQNAMELIETLESHGLHVCLFDTSGCDPLTGSCKLLGKSCGVHLSGLGCQKRVY
jgi:hypothetical protein